MLHVLDWNETAIQFYKKMNATFRTTGELSAWRAVPCGSSRSSRVIDLNKPPTLLPQTLIVQTRQARSISQLLAQRHHLDPCLGSRISELERSHEP